MGAQANCAPMNIAMQLGSRSTDLMTLDIGWLLAPLSSPLSNFELIATPMRENMKCVIF